MFIEVSEEHTSLWYSFAVKMDTLPPRTGCIYQNSRCDISDYCNFSLVLGFLMNSRSLCLLWWSVLFHALWPREQFDGNTSLRPLECVKCDVYEIIMKTNVSPVSRSVYLHHNMHFVLGLYKLVSTTAATLQSRLS
jgi:hypothetical protein